MTDPIRTLCRGLALALAGAFPVAGAAAAQAPDFWFDQPRGSASVYGGWSMPREGSDLFEFVRGEMTIERGAFNAPLIGADVAFRLTDRLDAVLGVETSRGRKHSMLHDWVELIGTDTVPIEQTTELRVTRATASGRFYLLERGRTIGSHAWVPARWSPYVGGGGGIAWYRFEQVGDFVDFQTIDHPEGPEVFHDRIRSTGSGGTAHVLAGLEWGLTRSLVLRGEYRYNWGSAPVDARAFRGGFDPIDLAGHRATIGIATRF
jgi:opacity protein-like surface antigen